MSNRALDPNEVGRLLPPKRTNTKIEHSEAWPSDRTLQLIAEAVNMRRDVVTLGAQQFTVKYDDVIKAVFIRPADGKSFAPCGWFDYSKLKDFLSNSNGGKNGRS